MNKVETCAECKKSKHRTIDEKADIIKRLNRVEGQIRGIKKMIDEDRYCKDVLIQISAVDNALKSLGNCILKSHLESCAVKEIKEGNIEIIDEIMELFKKLK